MYYIMRGEDDVSAITHIGLAVPDLDEAIQWYEKVLGFELIAGPYRFDKQESEAGNMTNDLQGESIKKMKNAHLTCDNQVGIELFEFQTPEFAKEQTNRLGYFHICVIVNDVEQVAAVIAQTGGKKKSQLWNTRQGKPYYLIYCEDPYGNTIELYSHSTELMYGNKDD